MFEFVLLFISSRFDGRMHFYSLEWITKIKVSFNGFFWTSFLMSELAQTDGFLNFVPKMLLKKPKQNITYFCLISNDTIHSFSWYYHCKLQRNLFCFRNFQWMVTVFDSIHIGNAMHIANMAIAGVTEVHWN